MTKPHHMRPPGRPLQRTDAQKAALAPSEYLCSRGTLSRDLENLERVLSNKPLKPPTRKR